MGVSKAFENSSDFNASTLSEFIPGITPDMATPNAGTERPKAMEPKEAGPLECAIRG
jgi:hypothetical protein